MEAKRIMNIIEDADCCTETCFTTLKGTSEPLGWARKLIEVAFEEGRKAGYEEAIEQHGEKYFDAGQQAGRQEVVEWIKQHTTIPDSVIQEQEWQAKCKEWLPEKGE